MITAEKHKNEFIKASEAIHKAKHVLLATHENPDADGLGAMLAIASYLENEKVPFTAYSIGKPPSQLSFLPLFDRLTSAPPPPDTDTLIGFDYGSFARLRIGEMGVNPSFIITLDHHPQQTQKGDINIVDVDFSSTCEMAYSFLKVNGVAISKDQATCIYAGLYLDTGGFAHSNTSPDTFRIGAELKEAGADTEFIAKRVFGIASVGAASAMSLALSRITVDKEARLMYAYLSSAELEKVGTEWEDVEPLMNMMNRILVPDQSIGCTALFKDKNDGTISVSFRSDSEKKYNARKLAESVGGGGHQYASAAKISGTLEEAVQKVLQSAKKNNFSAAD